MGDKDGLCIGLTNLPSYCADGLEIWASLSFPFTGWSSEIMTDKLKALNPDI